MIRRDVNNRLGMDFTMLFLLGFVVLTLILLTIIGKEAQEQDVELQGNIVVEVLWPDDEPGDVDVWMRANGETVSYKNESTRLLNLLRDDLGINNDYTDMNAEMIVSRGIPDGDWLINLHLYRQHEATLPLDVRVIVRKKQAAATRVIARVTATLHAPQDEVSAIRFKTKDGRVLSVERNPLYEPLARR